MRVLESISWTDIASALRARSVGEASMGAMGASIDSRTLERGDIFFALKGEHVDGHDHLASAFEKGASAAVVRQADRVPSEAFALVVDDPEIALFELGRLIRSRSGAEFVAITGSAGKTTAKDFTAEVLRAKGPVLATRGNLNNHLGVPLTVARLETDQWAAVIECGMSRPGEIARLVRLIRPRVAAVTNVAAAHLEFFSSVDEIAYAKSEVFETLGADDVAVAPADEPILRARALSSGGATRLFGDGDGTALQAASLSMSLEGSRFELLHEGRSVDVQLKAPGPHAVRNFLVAASIALALGLSLEDIAARASRLAPGPNRGAVRLLQDDILLIDDSYNSNPKALLSAVETLGLARDRRRVACIGDMLELGPKGPLLHREAGASIGPRVDLLLGVGPLSHELVNGAANLPETARRAFATSADLAAEITHLVKSHDAVLVKGSRGVCMERVVEALVKAHPGAAA